MILSYLIIVNEILITYFHPLLPYQRISPRKEEHGGASERNIFVLRGVEIHLCQLYSQVITSLERWVNYLGV